MNFRSGNFYIILFVIVAIVIVKFGIFGLQLLDVASYSGMFLGIGIFYSSYLKQYKSGIVIGSALFLTGSILFVIAKYEILNFESVFVPSLLIILGLSLLIANLLTKVNSIAVLFSVLSLIAGVWLMIARGNTNVNLFLSAAYEIFKSYWIIIVVSTGIIFLSIKNFKKKSLFQN